MDADGGVSVAELVTAVDNSIQGCPSYAAEYTGSVALDGGSSATFELSTRNDGTATATVVVRNAGATEGGGAQVVEISLLGTVDLDSGVFTVTGSGLENGETVPVEASGVLPLRNEGAAAFDFSLGEQTFTGTIESQRAITPTPTPTPTPISTNTPTATTVPGCGGGSGRARFSNVSPDVNANQLDTLDLGSAAMSLSVVFDSVNLLKGRLALCPAGLISRTVTIGVGQESAITPGTTISLNVSSFPGLSNSLTYGESTAGSQLLWFATSGTLAVQSIEGDIFSIRVSNARMESDPSGQQAMGSFTLDLEATFVVTRRSD